MHVKLIRSDTGDGIPDAVLSADGSMDHKSWYSLGGVLVTGSNGDIGPITVITPDPRPIVKAIPIPLVGDAIAAFIELPMTAYVKLTFAGDSTYADSETTIKTTLAE